MITSRWFTLLLMVLCIVVTASGQAQLLTITHHFENGTHPKAARYPQASLVQGRDGSFYGTTQDGGAAGYGTIFKITPRGKLVVLHSFNDGTVPHDGRTPQAGLAAGSDGDFYGMTAHGGAGGEGTVYKITPTGTETILHHFGDGSVKSDGASPDGPLLFGKDGNFYGTTFGGGSTKGGTVFKITPHGDITLLHSFDSSPAAHDAYYPCPSLTQAGNGILYGTTQCGGSANNGSVFQITPTGTETILHNFGEDTPDDGTQPHAGLTLGTGGNLYGTTFDGGIAGRGTVFKITPTGVETVIHSFDDYPNTQVNPLTPLVQGQDGDFYGTTSDTIFKITPDGVVTTIHRSYEGGMTDDGGNYNGPLLQAADGYFYGTSSGGGLSGHGFGTVFKITPSGGETVLYRFGQGPARNLGDTPNPLVLGRDGFFYGTTQRGGAANCGTVVKVDSSGAVTVLYEFRGAPKDGFQPQAALVQGRDGDFYGTTSSGGTEGKGTVFKVTPSGAETVIYNVPNLYGSAGVDVGCSSALIQGRDGNFYATTSGGGMSNGTVYKITPEGIATTLHTFGDGNVPNDGLKPLGALVQGNDGDFYGTTSGGGTGKDWFGRPAGTVFKITPKGIVTILHSFGDGTMPVDGTGPKCTLIEGRDGGFYGTTQDANDLGEGTIFRMTPSGVETLIARFSRVGVYNDGQPLHMLVFGSDGDLYGENYGQLGYGTIFKITPEGGETILHAFCDGSVRNDGQNPTGIVFGRNGKLYGTTLRGGSSDAGTVFILTLPGASMSMRPELPSPTTGGTSVAGTGS